ncbi:MAG: PKD domain-containing protein [Paraglaciecola sp.]|nr:PKD domain-containing protein [Paraglaciecola sp.]
MKLTFRFLITTYLFLVLSACGSSENKIDSLPVLENKAPTLLFPNVEHIYELTTKELTVDVNDVDGQISSIKWVQLTGPSLSIEVQNNTNVSITAPSVERDGEWAEIEFTATDDDQASVTATLKIQILNVNIPPVANAGEDFSVRVGNGQTLSGVDSYDPDGHQLIYFWSLVAPDSSQALLKNSETVSPRFIPDVSGDYIATLIVTDEDGASHSDQVTIRTEAINMQPVSRAGLDQNVETGTEVFLDGKDSYDPEGAPLNYLWRLITPDNSTARLNDEQSQSPTFFSDVDGRYEVYLIVSDGELDSTEDKITIDASTSNSAPVSIAGSDIASSLGVEVQLDGSASFDPNNDILSYEWVIVSQPVFSNLTITGVNTVTPSFTPTRLGSYVLSLKVSDGEFSDVSSLAIDVSSGDIYIDDLSNENTRYGWPFNGSISFNEEPIDEQVYQLSPAAFVATGADFTIRVNVIDRNGIVTGFCGDLVDGQVIRDGEIVPFTCSINKATGGRFDVEFRIEVVGYEDYIWTYRVQGQYF